LLLINKSRLESEIKTSFIKDEKSFNFSDFEKKTTLKYLNN
jgi:hypothetical protein